jgi:hypothetical protein
MKVNVRLFAALKMQAIYSSVTSVDFHQVTCCYIPEDRTPHNDLRENHRSNMTNNSFGRVVIKNSENGQC